MRESLAIALATLALLLAFLPWPAAAAASLVVAATSALLLEPAALGRAASRRTLVVALLVGATTALAVAPLLGISRGVALALAASARFGVLVILAALASRHLDADRLIAVMQRVGLARFAWVIGLALNLLPHLTAALSECTMALAIRRGRSLPRWRDLPQLVEVQLAHAARLADEAAAAASLRGHDLLGRRPLLPSSCPAVVLVTGRPDSGKTSALQGAVSVLRAAGTNVAGVLQPGILEQGKKVGFVVRDVTTNEEHVLARRVTRNDDAGRRYEFAAEGFVFARRVLARATGAAVVFVDEIGPREIDGAGHFPALRALLMHKRDRTQEPRVLVCGVRRSLVPSLLDLLRSPDIEIVDVETVADGSAAILAAMARLSERR